MPENRNFALLFEKLCLEEPRSYSAVLGYVARVISTGGLFSFLLFTFLVWIPKLQQVSNDILGGQSQPATVEFIWGVSDFVVNHGLLLAILLGLPLCILLVLPVWGYVCRPTRLTRWILSLGGQCLIVANWWLFGLFVVLEHFVCVSMYKIAALASFN